MKINRCRVCGKMPGFVGVKRESGIIYHQVECRCGNNARSVSSLGAAIARWNKENEVRNGA
jgi:hypothetical protein